MTDVRVAALNVDAKDISNVTAHREEAAVAATATTPVVEDVATAVIATVLVPVATTEDHLVAATADLELLIAVTAIESVMLGIAEREDAAPVAAHTARVAQLGLVAPAQDTVRNRRVHRGQDPPTRTNVAETIRLPLA